VLGSRRWSERGRRSERASARPCAELVDDERYETRAVATASLADYIDGFYNTVRRHSSSDYLSPIEFELKRFTKEAA
jgi:transposase InsO family protein